jgi:hypothetical protein
MRLKLVNRDQSLRELCEDLKLAAQGLNDPPERRNLHLLLPLELRQARLVPPEGKEFSVRRGNADTAMSAFLHKL